MTRWIEKLLEQCRIETYGVNGVLLEIGFDAEKFAELIINECLNECHYACDNDAMQAENAIRNHFGIS